MPVSPRFPYVKSKELDDLLDKSKPYMLGFTFRPDRHALTAQRVSAQMFLRLVDHNAYAPSMEELFRSRFPADASGFPSISGEVEFTCLDDGDWEEYLAAALRLDPRLERLSILGKPGYPPLAFMLPGVIMDDTSVLHKPVMYPGFQDRESPRGEVEIGNTLSDEFQAALDEELRRRQNGA
jgi:hypothetical protein